MNDEQKRNHFFDEYHATAKTYTTMDALHTMAEYWVENEIIIELAAQTEAETNGPQWTPDVNDQDSMGEFFAERDVARYTHDQTLIPMHRYSSIIMLYSTVERELFRLVENLEKEHGPQKLKCKDIRGSKVEQISKFCEVFFSFRLADCSQYAALTELQKLRDCIIHCLGDVSLSIDKDFLVKLGQKRKGLFVYPNNDIHIDEECLEQFLKDVWSFFVSVFDALNWQLATQWQDKKLEKTFERLKTRHGKS
jgi:hypothetical protein